MEGSGFTWSRVFVEMEIDFDGPPEPPRPPAGVTLRQFDPHRELEELAAATSEGFRDHFGFVESPIDVRVRRLQHWMEAANHDPKLWWVAEADGKIVGFNICEPESEGDPNVGYVASLAVLRSHRGQGLGRALLLEAFAEFHRRGDARGDSRSRRGFADRCDPPVRERRDAPGGSPTPNGTSKFAMEWSWQRRRSKPTEAPTRPTQFTGLTRSNSNERSTVVLGAPISRGCHAVERSSKRCPATPGANSAS